jgi:ribosomal protein S27E
MNLPPATLDTTAGMLSAGIAAARSGDEARARSLLTRVVEQDEHNATGWLWLSSVVDNLNDLEICLENVAILEPENVIVHQRLAGVKAQQAELRAAAAISRLIEPAAPRGIPPTTAPPEVSPASTTVDTADQPHVLDVHRLFICPQCAGRMRFNPEIIDLQCQACGHIDVVDEVPAQPPERILSRALRTPRGHRWASAERLLRCQQCGAQTVFPPAQTSVSCPYCGHAVFGTAPEDQELEAPQALIPMKLEADQARQQVRAWLSRGFFAPGDLTRSITHGLQPVYVPLWLFNAAITLHPADREKQVYLYANWVVPGLRSLSSCLVKHLEPFTWGNLIEFKPDYLAGWSATTYDTSAAVAAQQAKAEMETDARHRMSSKPLEAVFSSASFSTESFWLVLFPIWIASFTYRHKIYRVLVNGETGQVAGDKPFSWNKVLAVAAASATTLGLIGFVLLRTLNALALPPELSVRLQPILNTLQPVCVFLVPIVFMLIVMVVLAFRD